MLLDHLLGGQYYSVTDEHLIKETDSVPTTNVSPERDFAVFDRLLREKPNAMSISLESLIKTHGSVSCGPRSQRVTPVSILTGRKKTQFSHLRSSVLP